MSRRVFIKSPAPILNTHEFDRVFHQNGFERDLKGHIRSLEFIALKGMSCLVKAEIGHIYRVSFPFYPNKTLYVDGRFTSLVPLEKLEVSLTKDTVLSKMVSLLGLPYVWGGNWSLGIPEMLALYPPAKTLTPFEKELWLLKGVDCSGLLFEATGGRTPRNTSELMHFGREVKENFEPLDLIVLKGHLMIVLNKNEVIESRESKGVVKDSLQKRVSEIGTFIVRRWPQNYF